MNEPNDEVDVVLKRINDIIGDCVRDTHRAERVPLTSLQSCFHSLGSAMWSYPKTGLRESLLFCRTLEWIEIIVWSQIAILSGVYESAIRELRYLLEDVLVSAIADKRNPAGSIEDKLKIVEELGREKPPKRGGGLIRLCRELGIIRNDEIKRILQEQYNRLCDFAHPSREIVERRIGHERDFRFSFDPERYNHTVGLYVKTVDCLLLVIFWQMDDDAQVVFANWFCSIASYNQDFIETERVCRPIERKWWKDVTEDLMQQFDESRNTEPE